ncbi:DUF1203 domain-containing protein [Saccharothrix syringae]|uniref:DUF1203 domain-containing protein n=1 Tax=Saccharothrix syringae TaxID=103733 RepID=A0A5Q0GSJ7_SACSY|nr:DUF1203 domain-containing protein [Saccharothrix syringae]QFZ16342.1 DUF1203 domain-containing protein [Saccharothrix syringae]
MKIHAIPTDVLTRARELAGTDEHHELHAEAPDTPLRCCLRRAGAGEPLVLFRYAPSAGRGPYEEVGPVFAHAEPCAGPAGTDELPAALCGNQRLLRAYTADGRIHDGGVVAPGALADGVAGWLDDPRVAEVQVRSASHGCFLFAVTRD